MKNSNVQLKLRDCEERDFVKLEDGRELQIWAFEPEGVKLTNPNSINNDFVGYFKYKTNCEVLSACV